MSWRSRLIHLEENLRLNGLALHRTDLYNLMIDILHGPPSKDDVKIWLEERKTFPLTEEKPNTDPSVGWEQDMYIFIISTLCLYDMVFSTDDLETFFKNCTVPSKTVEVYTTYLLERGYIYRVGDLLSYLNVVRNKGLIASNEFKKKSGIYFKGSGSRRVPPPSDEFPYDAEGNFILPSLP